MQIENVSFIVIAKDEEFGIEKCLYSIQNMKLKDCEVICINSGSEDKTLEIMKSYKHKLSFLKIFDIKGKSNSSISRNVGIKNSNKKYIFFVDGDIELNAKFISNAIFEMDNGYCQAVTGKLKEYHYDKNFEKVTLKIEDRFKIYKRKRTFFSGGNFMVEKAIVEKIGYFEENFDRHQDLDYTLRITSKFIMIAIPIQMGIHHTIPYYNKSRLKNNYFRFHKYFLKLILKNIFKNFCGTIILLKNNISYVFSTFFLVIFMFGSISKFNVCIYIILLMIFVFDLAYGKIKNKNLIYRIYMHYFSFLVSIINIFFINKKKYFYITKEI